MLEPIQIFGGLLFPSCVFEMQDSYPRYSNRPPNRALRPRFAQSQASGICHRLPAIYLTGYWDVEVSVVIHSIVSLTQKVFQQSGKTTD